MNGEEKKYFDKLMIKHEKDEKESFSQIVQTLILKIEFKIQEGMNGLAVRLDGRITKLDTSLQLHDLEGKQRTKDMENKPCEQNTKAIQKHKEESKLKDKEHDDKFKAVDVKFNAFNDKVKDIKKLFWVILIAIALSALKQAL